MLPEGPSSNISTVPMNFHAHFLRFFLLLGRVANLESLAMALQVSSNSCLAGGNFLRSRSFGVNKFLQQELAWQKIQGLRPLA